MNESVAVFLRFPEPGKAKTRLIPALGPIGAARFFRIMAQHICSNLAAPADGCREIIAFIEPAEALSAAQTWLGERFTFRAQPEGDLGQRLKRIFNDLFACGRNRVVAVGSDCIGVDAAVLDLAFEQLQTRDAVLGPASDGGYYLIGLSKNLTEVFDDIPWSSEETLSITLERLAALGASIGLLPELSDVDTPADLAALPPDWKRRAEDCAGAETVWD